MAGDAHSEMLDLAVKLAEEADGGRTLTPSEQIFMDVLWIDTQVSPNGFDGWLYNTSSERIADTLEALEHVGCPRVLEIVQEALAVAGVDPDKMSDKKREARMESLSEEDRERLSEVDAKFYDAVEDCMTACREFVAANQQEFGKA
jgi:hypothetical protein